MNRAQLTEELIAQKKDNTERIQEIAKLKASLFRFKSYVSYIAVLVVVGAVVVTAVADYQWSKERVELETVTKKFKEISKAHKELEKEYNIISSSGSVVHVGKEDLLNDLATNYPDVSMKTKIAILETILSESEKYGMNPLILYSIAYTESTFRHWLEHETATIQKNGKPVKIKAVGLMGTVWEWHGEELKDSCHTFLIQMGP